MINYAHRGASEYARDISKKRYANEPENIVIFKNVNPAIIERAIYEKIQNLQDEISNGKSKNVSTDMFIATVRKYTRACVAV